MRYLLLLAFAVIVFAQPSSRIVSGVCEMTLNNTQADTKPCDLNISSDGNVPTGTIVHLQQVSGYCISPIDRAVRMVRLDTQISNGNTGTHYTFVQVVRREVRTPGLHAEYMGSQLMDAYAGAGFRINATVTAELGSLSPPIKCEVRFQGTVVPQP
ncbi:MAG: hypothetical protein ABI972_14185 [Acidobacteriota bacterium]